MLKAGKIEKGVYKVYNKETDQTSNLEITLHYFEGGRDVAVRSYEKATNSVILATVGEPEISKAKAVIRDTDLLSIAEFRVVVPKDKKSE